MADEFVTIKIKVNADTREIKRVNRELAEMGVQARLAEKSTSNLGKSFSNKLDPSIKKTRGRIQELSSALATFNKLALKVFAVSFVVAAASLASVNALFATGRFLVQAYRVTMQALAIGVTAVGAGLAVVAAAQREYNAALYAYSYKSAPAAGRGLNQSRSALRMLQNDSTLAVFGIEALNASFATLSKSGQVTGRTVGALRAFADFAAAGGDPTKNLQAVAEVLAMIEKKGKVTSEAITEAKKVNVQFAAALDGASKSGKGAYQDLIKYIETSGVKAFLGVEGQADLLGNTLVGKFKRFKTGLISLFADIGQPLLGPVSEAFEKMYRIIHLGILRLAPDFIHFGSGRMLNGLVTATQKLTDLFINLTRKYLDGSIGMLDKFVGWWKKVQYWFNRIVDNMRPLLDGGSAIIQMFGPVLGEVFGKVGDIIQNLDRVVVGNRDEWNKFAKVLKDAVTLLGDFITLMFNVFDRALPIITPIIGAFVQLANAIMAVVNGLSQLPGVLGPLASLASMFGFIGLGMATKNWKNGNGFSARPGGRGGLSRFNPFSGFSILSSGRGAPSGVTPSITGASGPMYGPPKPNWYSGWQGRLKGSMLGEVGMGRGMAASLGLGTLMLPRVNEAAQGYVGAGASLAGMAPMMGKYGKLGLAGGIGIAGFGTMMSAQTGAGGAVSGAMGAASVASLFAGPAGILATAAIGGIVGFFRGRANQRKKKIANEANKMTGELYTSVAKAMIGGDTGSARSALQEQVDKGKELAQKIKDRNNMNISVQEAATLKTSELAAETQKFLEGPLDRFDQIVRVLGKTSGLTEQEIVKLANSLGVNLYDDTISLIDVMKELGLAVNYTADQIHAGVRDIIMSGLSIFDQKINALEAQSVIDDSVTSMQQMLASGGAGEKEMLEFVKGFVENLMILNPDKPAAVAQELVDQFGPNGYAYDIGGAFEGQTAMQQTLEGPINDYVSSIMPDIQKTLIQQLGSELASMGYQFDTGQFAQLLGKANIDLQDLQRLEEMVAGGFTGGASAMAGIKTFLASVGIFDNFSLTGLPNNTRDATTIGDKEAEIRQQFFNAVESAFGAAPDWMKQMPPWWTELGGKPVVSQSSGGSSPLGEDTFKDRVVDSPLSSPSIVDKGSGGWSTGSQRPGSGGSGGFGGGGASTPWSNKPADTTSSRLSATLARHRQLNSGIAGKRTITSSFRTNNLGSLGSDHLTGRAYDLIGQNLGAYSQLVRNSGGFAEFHGLGSDRHLHVVPGSGPMGDTSMPSMVSSAPLPSSATTNNYSIVVNGGNDSAQNIARKVMDEIARAQRSARERK